MKEATESLLYLLEDYKLSIYIGVIALPSVKYSGRVETDVFESRLGRGEMGCEPACCENNN